MELPKNNKFINFLNFLPFIVALLFSAFLIYKFSQFPIKEIFGQYPTPGPTGGPTAPPGGGGCGDGNCESPPETASNCPQDCGGDPNVGYDCIGSGGEPLKCSTEDCGGSGGTYACWPATPGGPGGSCPPCFGTCDCPETTHSCTLECGASGCYSSCGGGGDDDDDGGPPPCYDTPPAKPVLNSPNDGSTLPLSGDVVLNWDEVSSWGINCAGNDNFYVVYYGVEQGGSCTPGSTGRWDLTDTSVVWNWFTLVSGQTYCWMVQARNGAQSISSDTWSFTMRTDAWYQTQGGDIHANGGSITSIIPSTCIGACQPYLMLTDDGLPTGQAGAASWLTGSLSLGDEVTYPDNLAQDTRDLRAMAGSYSGTRYDYTFWQYNLGDEEGIEEITTGSTNLSTLGSAEEAKIYKATAGVFNIEGNITGGKKVIILHSGNTLGVTGNIIVDKGSFLMVVTSGNLVVSNNVSLLQGIYMANGTIDFGSGALGLTVQGSMIGWSNINLSGRDFNDVRNDTQAVLKFIYRPDLIIEAPEVIRRPQYHWQEIVP